MNEDSMPLADDDDTSGNSTAEISLNVMSEPASARCATALTGLPVEEGTLARLTNAGSVDERVVLLFTLHKAMVCSGASAKAPEDKRKGKSG